MNFTKPALSFDQQMDLLVERGLTIDDRERAAHWLEQISYYRLSPYFLPFKDGEQFSENVEFNDVAGLYIFDRKLRLCLLDAIERVEVSLRTAMTYQLGHSYGPFGYADSGNFAPTFDHAKFMEELANEENRSKELFVGHFRAKYTSEEHLPVWMATELLSFGTMSRLYKALSPVIKSVISSKHGVSDTIFASWLHTLSYVRNVCAHHSRMWNRALAIKPQIPSRSIRWPHTVPDNGLVYAVLVIVQHMLRTISPRCSWRQRLFAVIDSHPNVVEKMHFPENWRAKAIWRLE